MRILKPIKMSSPRDITNLIAKLSPRSVTAGNMYVNTPVGSEVIVPTPQGPQAVPTVGSARSPGRLSPTTSAMLGINTPVFTPANANPDLSQFPTRESVDNLRSATPITRSPTVYGLPTPNSNVSSPMTANVTTSPRTLTPRAVTFSQTSSPQQSPRAVTPIPIQTSSPQQSPRAVTPIPIQTSSPAQLSPRMVPLPASASSRVLPRVSSAAGVTSPGSRNQQLINDEQQLVADERQLIADEREAAVKSAKPALITPTYSNTARPSYSSQPRSMSTQSMSAQPLSTQPRPVSVQPIPIQPRSVETQQSLDEMNTNQPRPVSVQPRPVSVQSLSTQPRPVSVQSLSTQPRPVSVQSLSTQPRPVSVQSLSAQPRPVSVQQMLNQSEDSQSQQMLDQSEDSQSQQMLDQSEDSRSPQMITRSPQTITPIPITRSPQTITPIPITRSPQSTSVETQSTRSPQAITPIPITRSPQTITPIPITRSPQSTNVETQSTRPTSLTPQVMVTPRTASSSPRTASLSPDRNSANNIPTRVSTPIPIPVSLSPTQPRSLSPVPINKPASPRSALMSNGLPMPGSVRSAPTPVPIVRTPGSVTRTPGVLPSVSTPGRVSVLGPSASEKNGINDLNDFLRSHHYTPIKYTGQSVDKVDFVKAYSPLGPICYIAINIAGQATITTSDMNLFTINNDQDVAKSSDINAASGIVNAAIGAAIECRDGICTNTTYQGLDNIPVGVTTFVTQEKMDASKSRYDLSSGDSLSYPIILASSIQTDANGIARAVYDSAMKLRKTALSEQVATLSKLTKSVAASAEGLVRFNLALEKDLDTNPNSLISLNTNALLEKRSQLMNNDEYPVAQVGVDNTNVNAANQAILSTEAWLNRFDDMTHKHINLAASLASNMDFIEQFQTRIYDHTAQLFLSAFTISDPALSDVNGFFSAEAWGLPASFTGVKDFTSLTPQQWEEATSGNSNSAQLARALQRAVTAMMV